MFKRDVWRVTVQSFVTRHVLLLTALFFAALAAFPLFLNSGFLNTRGIGDSPNLLFRVHQLLATLAAGEFPARWMPDAAYGYGMPYFTYYASFSTHVAAAFKLYGFSFVNAIKLAQLLALLVAAGGMYGWMRVIGFRPAAGLLASAAYTFAPFHLVNLYIRGDSLAELWAMSFYPLVLWAAHASLERPSFSRAFALALAVATLICTHNISALNFMPFVVLYILCHSPSAIRQLLSTFSFLLWGFALAAFFWLPALLEGSAVQLGGLTGDFFSFTHHFRAADLVQTSWLFDYKTNPFSMGLIQTLLALGGLLALLWRAAHTRQWPALNTFLLLGLALSTVMITPLSQPLWENLPLLSFTQFPWRFLSIQALFTAALAAQLVEDWRLENSVASTLQSLILSSLLAFATLTSLNLTFIPLTDEDVTAERLNLYEYFTTAIGNTVNSEYLPQAVRPRPFTSDAMLGRAPRPKALSGEVSGEREWKHGARERWRLTVSGSSPATVAVPTYFWPGWQATTGGQVLAVRAAPGLGWIAFDLPPGVHAVELWLGRTPLRATAEVFSALALIVPLIAFVYRKGLPKFSLPTYSPSAQILIIFIGILSVTFVPQTISDLQTKPRALIPLNADYNNSAYFHHSSVPFANGATLSGVIYSAETIEAGELLEINTLWNSTNSATATFTLRSHAAWVGGADGALVTVSVFIDSGLANVVTATLTIPSNTPPGLYFITVALHDKQSAYPALTANGKERSLIHLAPILVTQRAVPVKLRQPVADFGAFDLQTAGAEQQANRLQLNLLWHARREIPANYALALRVRDLDGNEWGGSDPQPNYGFYPTALWQAGELIPDALSFAVPQGLPPGVYNITLAPYDLVTLAPLATFEMTATLHSPLPPRPAQWPLSTELALAAVEIPPQAAQGETLTLNAEWVTLAPLTQNWRAQWALTAANGEIYSYTLPLASGSMPREWGASLTYLSRPRLPLPNDFAPGLYALSVQLVDEAGALVGSAASLGQVEVTGRARTFMLPPLQTLVGAVFDEQIALAGYNAEQTAAELKLQLAFQALAQPRGDYKYFVHLFNPVTENIPAQIDTVPRAFTYPTPLWVQDEVVVDEVTLKLENVPPGAYRLAIGWYNPNAEDLPRLPARSAEGQPLEFDRVILPLEVNITP